MTSMEKQRLVVNETSDKADYLQLKVHTIEKNLPTMVEDILEMYFDKKVTSLLGKLVTKDDFSKALSVKLDSKIFREYERMIASDRTQELKNFGYEEALFKLERTFQHYVTNKSLAE